MKATDELKPCPFCGTVPRMQTTELTCGRPRYFVDCEGSGCKAIACTANRYETALEAAEAWNTRACTPSIKDTDLPATEPLAQVPRIRYTDANGNVYEGWYAFHVKRAVCPGFDSLKPDNCVHCIVTDGFADWGMHQGFRHMGIIPDGGTIELIGGER